MERQLYIGTSGWHYKHWLGTFYPEGTPASAQFAYYKDKFDTVEINNSFYRLPAAETFDTWRAQSPECFVFVVKASRYITHMKKLKGGAEITGSFFKNVVFLKEKLGPILFQLPPGWELNLERFEAFLAHLPKEHRYVFEFRNPTWYAPEVYKLLEHHNCAFCIYELAYHLSPEVVTTDLVYIRLHGPEGKYQGSYSEETLAEWAHKCRQWLKQGKDVYVYFDNDQYGYAAFNALTLKELLASKA